MPERKKIITISLIVAGLFRAGAQNPPPEKEKRIAAGETEAKRLLLLMDKDQNGKVSKQEFMNFMEAEFDRLDKNKDGALDIKELTRSQMRLHPTVHR